MKNIPLSYLPWTITVFIFACLYSCFYTHFVSSQCLNDQKSLLLEVETEILIPGAFELLGWNESTDCCQWSGVECDNSTGRVIGLDLNEKLIMGGINNSNSFFRLKFLQRLNLGLNPIQGEIPSAFGRLSNVIYLNLSYTSFKGQVPIGISQLVKLVVHDISNSLLLGDALYMKKPNLATIIQNLTNIKELYLDHVNISAVGNKWGRAISSSLPHLQVLSMANCDLRGEIHPSLSKLKHLSVIRLDYNSLSGSIPESFVGLTNLTTLSLAVSSLTGMVPGKIFQVPTLRTIDLSTNNHLYGTLPPFYKNLSLSLEEVILDNTNFSGLLPSTIRNLKRLRRIDLSGCKFQGSIPSSMGSVSLLEEMDISGNQFSGPIPSFSSMKNIKSLKFGHNNLKGSITATDWGKLLKLEVLDMSNNTLDGSIPMSLFSLPSLHTIDLGQNKFSGKIQLNELASIASSKLETLDLSSNDLEGPVPNSIFQLRELTTLDLSSNRFNGKLKLPELLHGLSNLKTLGLSHNNLSIDTDSYGVNSSFPQLRFLYLASSNLHTVPGFLKNQTALTNLDLSKNHISGSVPHWIWRIDSLLILNLSYNHFQNLEPPHTNKSKLFFLDLQSNNLQGQVPVVSSNIVLLDCSSNNFTSIHPDFGNYLSETMLLSFSRNNLYGSIPTTLCNATKLLLLNLEYNHFKGTIPDCLIAKSDTLTVLNLRGNNVVGAIPATFRRGCGLQTLDLNGNLLQGPIPRSLANCKALKVLDIGNNQLNDTFPCHLQNLSNLQVLVLRSYTFHGTIVCTESHPVWPLLQIVDLASNHFSGELTGQFFLKLTSMMAGTSALEPGHVQSEAGGVYYQNSVALTFKDYTYELKYILTILNSLDFSSNAFLGELPRELGILNALKVLNLSHNSFSGNIPSSFGKLSQIESVDLSYNALSGNIPTQLANLDFLSYLDLSFNKLSGKIPSSTQLQSFNASSYEGNQGLYGPPLTPISRNKPAREPLSSTSSHGQNWSSTSEIEWMLRGAEVGFPVGIIIFIGPILYIKRWREWYCKHLHRLVMKILRKEDGATQRRKRRSRQQRQRR